MTKPVATVNDIKATASSTSKHAQHPDWQGTWVVEPITRKTYDYFTLNGNPIAYEASCTFKFNGIDPTKNGVAVKDSETITLTAKQTTLHGPVLCHGDTENGKKGPMNQLRVESDHHLTTD